MAVMLVATVPGSTREQQQEMYDKVGDLLTQQEGFLFHASGPTEGGWRLREVWETREQLQTWLDETIFPALPDDAPEPEMEIVPIEFVLAP